MRARLHAEELYVNGAAVARIEKHVPAGMPVEWDRDRASVYDDLMEMNFEPRAVSRVTVLSHRQFLEHVADQSVQGKCTRQD